MSIHINLEKNKHDEPYFTQYTKLNSGLSEGNSIKLFRGNHGRKSSWLWSRKEFLKQDTKSTDNLKSNKLYCIKI